MDAMLEIWNPTDGCKRRTQRTRRSLLVNRFAISPRARRCSRQHQGWFHLHMSRRIKSFTVEIIHNRISRSRTSEPQFLTSGSATLHYTQTVYVTRTTTLYFATIWSKQHRQSISVTATDPCCKRIGGGAVHAPDPVRDTGQSMQSKTNLRYTREAERTSWNVISKRSVNPDINKVVAEIMLYHAATPHRLTAAQF